jgi:HK97 family phage prohead protease
MAMLHKLLDTKSAEFKFNGDTGEFEGYASVFGGVDSYGDTIQQGAFRKTLESRERPVRMRWNHFGPVIGKWVEMMEDTKGLYVRGQLTPGHSIAEDVKASLKHGAIDGLSIGFMLGDYDEKAGGGRDIKSVKLIEISVVEEPADLSAKVTNVKAALSEVTRLADIESILRDYGITRSDATALISCVKSLILVEKEQKSDRDNLCAYLGQVKLYP